MYIRTFYCWFLLHYVVLKCFVDRFWCHILAIFLVVLNFIMHLLIMFWDGSLNDRAIWKYISTDSSLILLRKCISPHWRDIKTFTEDKDSMIQRRHYQTPCTYCIKLILDWSERFESRDSRHGVESCVLGWLSNVLQRRDLFRSRLCDGLEAALYTIQRSWNGFWLFYEHWPYIM